MELDWEWPMSTGDKKDKIKLIRYMRVSISIIKNLRKKFDLKRNKP